MVRLHRRGLIGAGLGVGLVGFAAPAILRAQDPSLKTPTASQVEGPFYPYDDKPTDQDADLVRVTGVDAAARGEVAHVTGSVWDRQGRPLGGALVEIWQCDHQGHYLHPGDRGPRDEDFQGYGRTVADAGGAYSFRTIKPMPYPGRTPHIHVAVLAPNKPKFITQMYVAGDPQNARDFLYRNLGAEGQRAVTVELGTVSGSEPGALAGTFDIVLPLG